MCAALLVCVGVVFAAPAMAQGYIETIAPRAVIVDGQTGEFLFEKDADRSVAPASMSKLMTAAVVLDLIDKGELFLDTRFDVSERAWRTGGSKMFVLVDTAITVENLLKGLLVQSGNDAAIVISENVSGNEAEFVDLMNMKAAEWGLTQSSFANPSGNDDPNQRMSARDLGKLAYRIWTEYPEHRYLFGLREFTWSDITQENRNPLLNTFPGADGMKTGYTDNAGWGVVGTASRDGERRFIVVMGLNGARARNRAATRLMDDAFSDFARHKIFTDGGIVGEAEVFGGQADTVPLTVDRDVQYILHRQQWRRANAKIVYTGPLEAPIRKGEQAAVLKIDIPGQGTKEYPLYTAKSVSGLSIGQKMGLGLKMLFTPPDQAEVE